MRIVVNTCDANYWAVPLFIKWFTKSWPECPYEFEILTESLPMSCPLADVVRMGEWSSWSDLMIKYVTQIGDEPFMLILEDYIVYLVDIPLVEAAIALIENDSDVGMVRLVPVPGPTLPWPDNRFGQFDMNEPYALSLQAALWRPQVLYDMLDAGESPWQFEVRGSRERASLYHKFEFVGTMDYSMHYLNYVGSGKPRKVAIDVLSRIERGEFVPMMEVDYAVA